MRRFEYSDELVTVVKQFLEEDGWRYTFDETTGIFQFNLRIRGKLQKINYVIDVHENKIITYGFSLIAVDPKDAEAMTRMAEFICRVNYSMENGCFEMDFTDGEVRFRTFIDCTGQVPSSEIIRNSLYCTAGMFGRYAEGFVDLVFGGASAAKAFEKCEQKKEERTKEESNLQE